MYAMPLPGNSQRLLGKYGQLLFLPSPYCFIVSSFHFLAESRPWQQKGRLVFAYCLFILKFLLWIVIIICLFLLNFPSLLCGHGSHFTDCWFFNLCLQCYIVYLGAHSHGPSPTSVDREAATYSHYDLLGSVLGRYKSRGL